MKREKGILNNSYDKVQVEEYFYEKRKRSDVIINIPKEPIFFQEYNHEVIIGVFPQFATWSDNSVWELQVVKVTNEKLERTFIRNSPKELSDIISRFCIKNKSQEEYLRDDIIKHLKDSFNVDRVSKDVFVNKYKEFIRNIHLVTGVL